VSQPTPSTPVTSTPVTSTPVNSTPVPVVEAVAPVVEAVALRSSLLVSGAGSAFVNGQYELSGEYNGRPMYSGPSVSGCSILWECDIARGAVGGVASFAKLLLGGNSKRGAWIITRGTNEHFYLLDAHSQVECDEDKEYDFTFRRAKWKFDQLDADGNGWLQGPELTALAEWVLRSFNPEREASAETIQDQTVRLMEQLDADGNGKMEFDEFAEWFKNTCMSIEKFKKGVWDKITPEGQWKTSQDPEGATSLIGMQPGPESLAVGSDSDMPLAVHAHRPPSYAPKMGSDYDLDPAGSGLGVPTAASGDEDVTKALMRAKKKFDSLDADGNGVLEEAELHGLATWLWGSFHPGGQPLSVEEQGKEAAKLIERIGEKGKMSFEVFGEWFTNTCASIARFRQSRAKKAADIKFVDKSDCVKCGLRTISQANKKFCPECGERQ